MSARQSSKPRAETSAPDEPQSDAPAVEEQPENVSRIVDDTAVAPAEPVEALARGYHGEDAADLGADVRERDVAGFARHAELDQAEGREAAPVEAMTIEKHDGD